MSEFEKSYLKVGETWELPQELFLKWWSLLDELDRDAFRFLHHGDELLARFVCAMDYLAMQKCKGDKESLIQLAYHIAAKPYPELAVELNSPALKNRAARAWREDAVQDLLSRVHHRSTIRKRAEIENKVAQKIHEQLDRIDECEDMRDKAAMIGIAIKYMAVIDAEGNRLRDERTKRGIKNAREALKSEEENELSGRELQVHAKMLFGKMKPEELIALLPANVKDALAAE